jgi:DNA-binding GntR family transcriptional regulator
VRQDGRDHPEAQAYDAQQLVAIADRWRDATITAQDMVAETLREAILEGVLGPGVRLRQEELATLFDTSRIPVREALHLLEYEGLASSEPRRGFTVTALDADQIEEVYDLRIALESLAVRIAIPLMTGEDRAELQTLYEQMQAEDDLVTQLAVREQLYLRLYNITARPRLVGLILRLRQEAAPSLRWRLVQHSPETHQAIFEAVMAGDPEAAVEALTVHYRKVTALYRRFLREARGAQEPLARR